MAQLLIRHYKWLVMGNMGSNSQRILVSQAQAGMVLAHAVTLPNGVVLCGPGTVLNDHVIQRLTIRGIKRIEVQGNPLPARSQQPLSERIAALRRRFAAVRHEPTMALIERVIEREMTRRQ